MTHVGKVVGKALAQKQFKRLFVLVNLLSISWVPARLPSWARVQQGDSPNEKAAGEPVRGLSGDLKIVLTGERAERLHLGVIR